MLSVAIKLLDIKSPFHATDHISHSRSCAWWSKELILKMSSKYMQKWALRTHFCQFLHPWEQFPRAARAEITSQIAGDVHHSPKGLSSNFQPNRTIFRSILSAKTEMLQTNVSYPPTKYERSKFVVCRSARFARSAAGIIPWGQLLPSPKKVLW